MSFTFLCAQDCFTQGNSTLPNPGSFEPSFAIDFNRYAQDEDEGVLRIPLCATEFGNGCDGGRAFVVRHPLYNFETFENDVALIFLPVGLQITFINPIALNRNPNVPVAGQDLEAFGWGLTAYEDLPQNDPNFPQTGILRSVTNQECNEIYLTDDPPSTITGDVLCARTDNTAMGEGDSGTQLQSRLFFIF